MLLHADNLHFSYGERPALRGVSVSMTEGQVIALIGPNGSGKSTLIKVLLGVLHGQGQIDWEGKAIRNWTRRQLSRRVAYLPQSPAWQGDQKVVDVLRMGRLPYQRAFGLETSHDAEIVRRVGTMLELDDLLARPMDELSGGQRQRVFVGRCLVQEPVAMLLDEPNTFLDLKHQVELCALLKQLSQENNVAVLMASHDLNLASAFADQVMVLQEGKLVARGKPQDVMQAEMLSGVYGLKLERLDRPGEHAPVVLPKL